MSNHEQIFNIISPSSVPKYIQVADCIKNDIALGRIKKNQKLSSINELSKASSLSRDTIEKAYKYLQNKNIIYSVKGIGNFACINNSLDKLNILFLINKPSSYKMEIYNTFVDTIGIMGNVSMSLYYCDENLFVDILKKDTGSFDYYVIMPHFKNQSNEHVCYTQKVFETIEAIPKDKLLLLDNIKEEITGKFSAIFQDFKNDIFHALKQGLDKLKKYKKIILVYPNKAIFPYPQSILTGFRAFCISFNLNFEIISNISNNLEFKEKEAYITIQESDLVDLVQQVKAKNLILGKDIGVISYNETPLKALLDITVVSTNFRAMGKYAAELLLSNKKEIIKNEFSYIERSSL